MSDPRDYILVQERYQKEPAAFMTEVLDVRKKFLWSKMIEVAESVRDNPRTCVYAGHSVSKSYSAARLVLWFLLNYGPNATVITTAPSNDQVENILWKEIAVAVRDSKTPLGGVLTRKKLDFGEKWFAYGFATSPDTVTGEATRFQGYHNDHILVIFDEAAGILPQIWRAAEHLLTSGHTRWLVIGNPTSPHGQFAACEDDPSWNCITVSVKDTPNYKIESKMSDEKWERYQKGEVKVKGIIPGLSGREYETRMKNKYGEESNEYKIRILGIKPTYGQGTFFGEDMARAEINKHVRDLPIEEYLRVHTFWDVGPRHTAVVFAQKRYGWLRVIDGYYDDTGAGWAHHARMLQIKPYIYGDHWAPHDLWESNARNMSGEVNLELAREAGIDFKRMPSHSFMDRIAAVHAILATKVLFDAKSKGVQMLIEALKKYAQRKNERESTDEKPVFFKEPVKNWTRHPADAFGGLAIVYKWEGIAEDEPAAELVGAKYDSYGGDPFEDGI